MLIDYIKNLKIPNSEIWINEAKFGYAQIEEYCRNIKENGNVLEIGSGSGILLSMLSERYPQLNFEGIEPFGQGFQHLDELNTIIRSKGINIQNTSYEKFVSDKEFNLIFCVNVFEHLEDWRDFLLKMESLLAKSGQIIILSPNYSFP